MTSKRRMHIRPQWEPVDLEKYSEIKGEKVAQMEDVQNADVYKLWEIFKDNSLKESYDWTDLYQKELDAKTYVISTSDPEYMIKFRRVRPTLIFNKRSLNTIRHLNTLLNRTNEALADGGYFWCHARTSVLKKQMILRKYPWGINYIIYFFHYLWHRVCAKLPLIKRLYMAITKGKNRTYNRVEVLGRLCRAGFDIVDEEFLHGEYFVLGKKARKPIWDDEPSSGPLIKLRRVGKGGELIGVYKFRTMYSYSEYLQGYVYKYEGLQTGGKFSADYRVNHWGKLMRSTWVDELPMFINLFKGQLKLVGVRPLSRHYFSLYSPEMRELRIKVKPGLIPPFYYEKETPKTIEDVQQSERRYIEAYLKAPFKTDWKYFWGSIYNIIFKRKRSK